MDPEKIKQWRSADDKRRLSVAADMFLTRSEDIYKTYVPTGFEVLDKTLGGGLTPGVHYIGAISSLGKSTFCLQMADQMASKDIPVVYVSLEMPERDLAAKLISMHTMKMYAPPKNIDFWDGNITSRAKSSNMLTNRDAAAKFTAADWKTIEDAAKIVKAHGENIRIFESMDKPMTVDDIERYMQENYEVGNSAPVLIVDYLQLLAIPQGRGSLTDKQAVDYNVTKFRQIAAKYKTPVVVISSFNRSGYDDPVGMQNFKDSGNIEYSADTLMALQYRGIGENGFDIDIARVKYPREVELVVMKQRYGAPWEKISYNFSTTYNYFDELGPSAAPVSKKKERY